MLFIIPWVIDSCKDVFFYWQKLLFFSHSWGSSAAGQCTEAIPFSVRSLSEVMEVFVNDQFFWNSHFLGLFGTGFVPPALPMRFAASRAWHRWHRQLQASGWASLCCKEPAFSSPNQLPFLHLPKLTPRGSFPCMGRLLFLHANVNTQES